MSQSFENTRFMSTALNNDHGEEQSEVKLRPQNFNEFIGQKNIVENISIMVDSAKIRETALDHILLSGPPGLGKTSLAYLISGAVHAVKSSKRWSWEAASRAARTVKARTLKS